MWKLVSSYVPYLSKSFRVTANEFEQTINGVDGTSLKMPEERWEYCIRLTTKLMGYAVGSLYAKSRTSQDNSTITKAAEIINGIKSTLLQKVSDIRWTKDKESEKRIKKKITQLGRSIGFPDFVKNENSLRAYYNKFDPEPNFLKNIYNSVYFLNGKLEMKLKSSSSPENSWPIIPTDVSAIYKYNGNQLMVALGLLRAPMFDSNLPAAMKFGSLGFELASQIMNSLSLIGVQYESFGRLLGNDLDPWLMKHSLDALNETSHCVLQDLHNNKNSDHNREVKEKPICL